MVFIHGHTAKPALPEMACPLQAGMNMPAIRAMHFRQSAPYAIAVLRCQDQVDVIWLSTQAQTRTSAAWQCRANRFK